MNDVSATSPAELIHDDALSSRLNASIQRATAWLHDQQTEEGYWVGLLESNCCMEAQWVLAMHFLGITDDPKYPRVLKTILNQQREDGAWGVYYNSKGGDINTTVECYAALRAAGHDPDSEPLKRARAWILAHGGLKYIRNFTKYWLALIGEWPWEETPSLPPEMIYLPSWAPFNIYQFASWARGTMIPLTILASRQVSRPLPPERRLDELFPEGRENYDFRLPRRHAWMSWEGPFYIIDRVLRHYNHLPIKPGREHAIKLCMEWIIRHQDADGAWSGIQPPWIYSLMALHIEGYPLEHPVIRAGLEAFDAHWGWEKDGGVVLQASESPVWDTSLSLQGLLDCDANLPLTPSIQSALKWLLTKQEFSDGDWAVYVRGVKCGGWAFQRANRFYPDVDDTAVALCVLQRLRNRLDDPTEVDQAIKQGTRWMLAMQCTNGGWAAFDRDNIHPWLACIPFADFGELLDPPSVDVTSHVLEALALQGRTANDPHVAKALQFIRDEQEDDGSWFGRWGVNHVYGTGAVLPALRALKLDMNKPWIRKAADWLAAHQNDDGGWGETCASYMDDALRGVGTSTASQTAWALMGLLAVGAEPYRESIIRGLDFLTTRQREDGSWDEPEYTGTGFPGYGVGHRINRLKRDRLEQSLNLERAFMLNYNMYRHYFPMMALGRAREALTTTPQ